MGSTQKGGGDVQGLCLVLEDLTVEFGGFSAVDRVNLTIETGRGAF